MGRRKKKPTGDINWNQTAVDTLASFFVGLVLLVLDKLLG